MRALGILTALVAAGCISLDPPDGKILCNPNGKTCPEGLVCGADDLCHRDNGADLAMSSDDGGDSDQGSAPPDLMPPLDMTPLCARIQVSTLSGTGSAGLVNGAGDIAQFNGPKGITVDNSGSLYIADNGNRIIRKVLPSGLTSTEAAPAGATSVWRLVSSFGTLYYLDEVNDGVFRVTSATTATRYFSLGAMIAVAVSPANNRFYVSQNCGGISEYGSDTSPILYSGDGATCGYIDGTPAMARFNYPSDLVVDANNIIYVADTNNRRIRRVASDGSASTIAGSTQGHEDGLGAAAQFDAPTGITLDPQKSILYIADNTTIRAVAMTGEVTTIAGSTSGFVDGDGCMARFGSLDGITFFAGALYAVDVNRVRKIQLP